MIGIQARFEGGRAAQDGFSPLQLPAPIDEDAATRSGSLAGHSTAAPTMDECRGVCVFAYFGP